MYRDIQSIVLKILQEDEKARNNDTYLITRVLETTGLPTDLKALKDKRVSFESITRSRRLLQKTNPSLRANQKVTDLRNELQEEILGVVRDRGCANG